MSLKHLTRKLRKNHTDHESQLWYYLRAKRLNGLKFKRQQQIGKYIVDFVCFEKKLIIELDGSQHLLNQHKDQIRDAWLGKEGFRVLRFHNNEFIENKEQVVERIAEIAASFSPSP